LVVVAFGVTACGHKQDALGRATDCLRDHHARVVVQPTTLVKAFARKRSSFRSFRMSDNVLTVVSTPTAAAAMDAYRRANKAHAAVDPSRPAPLRRGRIVYWWAQPPSPSQRMVVRRCVGG
jgi:hypothetical protein